MNVIHPGDKSQTPVASLSCGTVDQCYLPSEWRLELIVNSDSFPFFLDDSFVQYDDKRLEGVLEIVSKLLNATRSCCSRVTGENGRWLRNWDPV